MDAGKRPDKERGRLGALGLMGLVLGLLAGTAGAQQPAGPVPSRTDTAAPAAATPAPVPTPAPVATPAPGSTATSSPPARGRLVLSVSGFASDAGQARVTVHSSARSFPGKHDLAFRRILVPIVDRKVQLVIDDLPLGSYAVCVHHDANGNDTLDTNFLGIPAEGIGCSRNPRPRFGPPRFEDARFVLEGPELALQIVMVK
ncbi:MAG: DUF2141 domain-containing protein [Myxococcota bacterium]|jgi:uncharacterized protein (DUF2141 family)|nr:DUF2141 domain-containing protein [Myxococcota bacterium]